MHSMDNIKAHLDIGCGAKPRNPYGCKHVYGLDIYQDKNLPPEVIFKQANLVLHNIPYEDALFDSVSAYDFLEHVPRMLAVGSEIRLPFIELMNEVWRVLKPNGIFYAQTPAYPHASAFQDPTHVNIITDGTHKYFCGEFPAANIYGFKGRFEVVNVKRIRPKHDGDSSSVIQRILQSVGLGDARKKRQSHLIWELRAIK